jgi:hypothetical protein
MKFKDYINEFDKKKIDRMIAKDLAQRDKGAVKNLLNIGDRVEGKYIDGSKYVGTITSRRFNTMNQDIMEYSVEVDEPIKVYGSYRDNIIISVNVIKKKAEKNATIKPSKKKRTTSNKNAIFNKKLKELKNDLKRIPEVFGTGQKADAARKDIEDEIRKLSKLR